LIVNDFDLADKKTDMNKIRKNVGMVFQHFNLYANKTVMQNICLRPNVGAEAQQRRSAMKKPGVARSSRFAR
jgi:ABC-type polar amino acid transport system ATPase subunit